MSPLDTLVENQITAKADFCLFGDGNGRKPADCNEETVSFSPNAPQKDENSLSAAIHNLGVMNPTDEYGIPYRGVEETFATYWRRLTVEQAMRFAAGAHWLGVLPQGFYNHYARYHPAEEEVLRENARRRRVEDALLTDDERRLILERDGQRCGVCGDTDGPFAVDHKLPRSRGGGKNPSNLWVLCRFCNCQKSDKTVDEFLAYRRERGYDKAS